MKIDLVSLTIENVLSFTGSHTIEFSQSPGLKFITGENKVEPRFGANGVGKSSIWAALSWCLYNATPRSQKASEIVSFGEKRPHVVTALALDGEMFTIERWGCPNAVTINGKPAEQIDIDRLIGLTHSRFLHSVLFGQAVPLFLDLSVPKRGEILDEILALEHWQDLSKDAAEKVEAIDSERIDLERKAARLQGLLAGLPDEQMLMIAAGEWDDSHKTKLNEMISCVEVIEKDLNRDVAARDALRRKSNEIEASQKPKKQYAMEIREKQQVVINNNRAIADCNATIKYYEEHEKCDVCQQNISIDFAADKVKRAKVQRSALLEITRITEIEISDLSKLHNAEHDRIVAVNAELTELTNKIFELNGKISANERALDQAVKNAEAAAAENENPWRKQLIETQNRRDGISLELAGLHVLIDRKKGEATAFEYWKQGFRRVRLFIINRIMASLEVEVASAASALGLPEWQIKLETETENKSGGVKQGVQILVKSPTAPEAWTAWSGGEEQRIKIAVEIGLASLIQRMSGTRFSFEVWDEPTAWLSTEGIDDLLECLQYRAEITEKSVWLLDHRTLGYGGFAETWQVTKTMRGSRVKMIAKDF